MSPFNPKLKRKLASEMLKQQLSIMEKSFSTIEESTKQIAGIIKNFQIHDGYAYRQLEFEF